MKVPPQAEKRPASDSEWRATEQLLRAADSLDITDLSRAAARLDHEINEGNVNRIRLGVYVGLLLAECVRSVTPLPVTREQLAVLADEMFPEFHRFVPRNKESLIWILWEASDVGEGHNAADAVAPFSPARFVLLAQLLRRSPRVLADFRPVVDRFFEENRELMQGLGA